MSDPRFEPTIASLLNYRCPEWFRDAKFGIYLHWGVYSVAEHGEWYPSDLPKSAAYAFRVSFE